MWNRCQNVEILTFFLLLQVFVTWLKYFSVAVAASTEPETFINQENARPDYHWGLSSIGNKLPPVNFNRRFLLFKSPIHANLLSWKKSNLFYWWKLAPLVIWLLEEAPFETQRNSNTEYGTMLPDVKSIKPRYGKFKGTGTVAGVWWTISSQYVSNSACGLEFVMP